MSDDIYDIQPKELVQLDLDRVVEIFETLSDPLREDDILRAVDTLETQIAALERSYAEAQFAEVGKLARRMIPVAEELGLTGVQHAAIGVENCARRRDGPGLAATIARLSRIGRCSVGALTDPQILPC